VSYTRLLTTTINSTLNDTVIIAAVCGLAVKLMCDLAVNPA